MAANHVVAIHQPNFLPWPGWFDKVARAESFILLDDAQFPKKGGTWTNRVKVLLGGEARWITVPIVRAFHGTREIREIEINEQTAWRRSLLGVLRSAYGSAPHFDEIMPLIEPLIMHEAKYLAAFNEHALIDLITALGLTDTKLIRASELDVASTGTVRLIELTQAAGGDCYLAGGGADGYQQDQLFAEADIQLEYQNFSPTRLPEGAQDLLPGLSIIDPLMQCGLERTAELFAR